MRKILFTLAMVGLVGLFAPAGRTQSKEAQKTYRVSGVVVNGATGQPLSRVRVSLSPSAGGEKEKEHVTAADGRFLFQGLQAGMWSLYAERKGFLRQGFGERPGVPNSLTQIVTGAGGVSEDLTFRLDPPAVISGKVTDEAGEPVLAALQVIIKLETGNRQFQRIKDAVTDDQGEFRIWDLPAVPCYLLAVTPTPPSLQAEGVQDRPATFPPQYYHNVTDPRAATLLDLKPGEESRADFMLHRSRGAAIQLNGETSATVVMLNGEGPGGAEVILAQLDPTESRSFYNVPPGRYKLTLFDQSHGSQSSRRIEVRGEDITIEVPFPDPAAVTASVRLVNADAAKLQNVMFLLHADGDYQTYARMVSADGPVTILGVASGRYKFMTSSRELYIQRVTSAKARVMDGMVDVPETGEVKLDVVLAGDGGQVSGNLRAKGKPVFPARVVLAPRAGSTNSVDYHSYQTESDGSFRFTAIKPGDYVLFATTDWKLEFANPEAIRKYLAAGHAVRVEPNGSVEVQIALEP